MGSKFVSIRKIIQLYLGNKSCNSRKNRKGNFEVYAERRLELLGNFKNRRQTERNFKKYDFNSFMKNPVSNILNSNSSMYREPVSHNKGAFKKAIRVLFH